MRILVDSSVLLDVIQEDQEWAQWSASKIEQHGEKDILVINPIIYAEISAQFESIEELDDALADDYVRQALPWDAAFLAARAFLEYRRRGGIRTSPLPDFYIGSHAAVEKMTVLTRDAKRFRTYFPTLELISPED